MRPAPIQASFTTFAAVNSTLPWELFRRELDHREDRAYRHRGARLDQDRLEHAACNGGNFSRHLVGFDLEKRLVRFDRIADFLVPVGHGAFSDRLAQLRHDHVHFFPLRPGHAARRESRPRRTSATMRATDGTTASSSWSAAGSGMWGVVIRTIGPLSAPKISSWMTEAISAPQPHSRGFSSTVKTRPVRADSASSVRVSSGTSERTSITVAEIPCSAASVSAALSARGTMAASAITVMSFPSRSTFA